MLIKTIKHLYLSLTKTQSPFLKDVKLEKQFLVNLKEPNDDFQRSFNQYLCQKYLGNKKEYLLYNIGSFILIIPFLIFFILRRQFKKTIKTKCDAIFVEPVIGRKIIPNELLSEFELIYDAFYSSTKIYLQRDDIQFVIKLICCYCFHFYFLLKCIMKVAMYRAIIQQYSPKAFIVSSEYSFTSSVLTAFCNRNGIEHINVMHGEKLFYIRDSFFRFDRCYVYDDHYIKLFYKLRAERNNFFVSHPSSLYIDINKYKNDSQMCDYKYYLANFNEKELRKIISSIQSLIDAGYKIKVRPHPRYSNLFLLNKYLETIFIEDQNIIGIEESLSNTKNVIGLYSTVLYQAYMNSIPIVFDDITYKDFLSQLKMRDYILYSKQHNLLSEII
jgi:hypothetical protein